MDQRLFVAEETCKRLDVFLSDQTEDFSRSRLKKLIEEGQVSVNGVIVKKAGAEIKRGDSVTVQIPEAVEYSVKPEDIQIELRIYQNDEVNVIKPDPAVIREIMSKGMEFDELIEQIKAEEATA